MSAAPAPVARVFYHRRDPRRGTQLFEEVLIQDDGVCLRTTAVIPAEHRAGVSKGVWELGLLPREKVLTSLRKYYFYGEHFDLLQFFDQDGALAGYYSDIALPLERRGDEYHLTDLFLDVWVTGDGQFHELDWDEFEAAAEQGLLSEAEQAVARATLARLRAEFQAGRYPGYYLR